MQIIKKKLVVIGGGFAGVNFIKHMLSSRATREAFEIILIDKNDYHLFTPALMGAVGSKRGPSEIFDRVAVKFDKIFGEKAVNIVKGEVSKIDFEKNQLTLKAGYGYKKPTEYDYLIISAGSETNYRDTVGAEKYTVGYKNFTDVIEIKSRIEKLFETKPKKDEVVISVIGAGDTGCGLMGALVQYTKDLAVEHGHPLSTVKFKIIQRDDKILPALSGWIRKNVHQTLSELGAEILLNSEIESINEGGIVLKNGDVILSNIMIWVAGVKSNDLVKDFGETCKTSDQLRLDGKKNVYVMGDVACLSDGSKSGSPTAQSAVHQAEYLARSFENKLKGKKQVNYKSVVSRTVIEIGSAGVYADLGFLKFGGVFAATLRRLIFTRYFTNLMSFGFAVSWLKKYRGL